MPWGGSRGGPPPGFCVTGAVLLKAAVGCLTAGGQGPPWPPAVPQGSKSDFLFYCTVLYRVLHSTGKCEYSEGQRALSKLDAIGGGASSGAVLWGRLGRGLVIIRGEFPGKGFRGKFRI